MYLRYSNGTVRVPGVDPRPRQLRLSPTPSHSRIGPQRQHPTDSASEGYDPKDRMKSKSRKQNFPLVWNLTRNRIVCLESRPLPSQFNCSICLAARTPPPPTNISPHLQMLQSGSMQVRRVEKPKVSALYRSSDSCRRHQHIRKA